MFISALFKSFLVVLVCSVQISSSLSQLDLTKSLTAVLEDDNAIDSLNIDPVSYREFDENVTFVTYLQSDQRAMVDLYNFTQIIVDFLIPKDAYPKGIIKVKQNDIEINNLRRNWKPIVKHYYVIILLIVAIFLFGVLMPIIGFFFYCFRCCCGKCGARTQPFDKKFDGCKKVLHATLLIGLTTLLLYGVVCTFICNVYLDDALQQAPDNFQNTVNDSLLYLQRTQKQVDYLLVKNFDDLKDNLFKLLDRCDDIISEKLAEYSNSASLNYLTQIVNNLPDVRNDLALINDKTNKLRSNASKLSTMLNHLKQELLIKLKNCSQCSEINDEINRLQITIDYDFQTDRYFPKLINVTVPIKNISNILNESIIDEVNKGQMNFEKIRQTISSEIVNEKDKVRKVIENAGHTIELIAKNISEQIDYVSYMVKINLHEVPRFDRYISEIFYCGLILSLALLLITLSIILGLICGICGKRPDGYDDDCCNKGSGSRFLLLRASRNIHNRYQFAQSIQQLDNFSIVSFSLFKEFTFVAFQVILDTLLRYCVSLMTWTKSDDEILYFLKNFLEERVCCKCDPEKDFSLHCFLKTCYCRTKENMWTKLRFYLYDICCSSLIDIYEQYRRKNTLTISSRDYSY